MLNYWNDAWDLREEQCPCDLHLIEFLRFQNIRNSSIFHFGTGRHHLVGIQNACDKSNNAVIGITCSRLEYGAYIDLAIQNPSISRTYKVFFGDIYLLDKRLLPDLDVVTLFHLCEYRSTANDAYDAMTDLEVARLLVDKLRPRGWVLFYRGSDGFDATKLVISEIEQRGLIEPSGVYKSLLVCRKAAA